MLVCLSAAPSNARAIQAAAWLKEGSHATLTALTVETPAFSSMSEEERRRYQAHLQMAETLGARTATVYGDDPALQVAEYARISGITGVVLAPADLCQSRLGPARGAVDRLRKLAPELDLHLISDRGQPRVGPRRGWSLGLQARISLRDTLRTAAVLAVCTLAGLLLVRLGFAATNAILIYLLGVLGIAMLTDGRGYSLISSLLSVLIFNYFFTYPYFTLLSDPGYLATFAVMFLVALLGSSLTTRVKRQAVQSADRAYRTEVLLETSQKLQKAEGVQSIVSVIDGQLGKLLERDLFLYLVGEDGALQAPLRFSHANGSDWAACFSDDERAAAEWVLAHNKSAGAGTGNLPDRACLYLAVRGTERVLAVVGIDLRESAELGAFEKNLMVAILDECGLALEKEVMRRAKQELEETARQEALRANLLRGISHDLRTPLTSISGNAGILLENGCVLDENKRRALYRSIYDDAMWLIHLVENLLSITRMENGSMKLNIQPELLYDVFQEALSHLDRNAGRHHIELELPDDLLMADMDARLIVQVVINLVNNAVKYTPEGSHILISARAQGDWVLVNVADDGPGVPDGEKKKLFEMFYTLNNTSGDGRRGLGLGLALCKAIVTAHGGRIAVTDNQPKGALFSFTLPVSEVNTHE